MSDPEKPDRVYLQAKAKKAGGSQPRNEPSCGFGPHRLGAIGVSRNDVGRGDVAWLARFLTLARWQ